MKKLVTVFGIVALLAIIGFSMVSCDDSSNSSSRNPFEGTWSGYDPDYDRVRVEVTSSTWTMTWPSYSGAEFGTYTYSGNTAILKDYYGETFGSASVSKNTLTLTVTGWGVFILSK